MKGQFTRKAVLQTWSRRAKPETKKSLPLTLMQSLKRPFFAAIIPRLFLIIFRYSQPILIRETIRYAAASPVDVESNRRSWLVLSTVVIYVGLALSTAIYRHRINKLKLMTKYSLVGLIHDETMNSPSVAYDNGEATTLMSNDADSLDSVAEMVHETWAQIIEVLIGIRLLASQVGWIWPLPLFLIYLSSYMSRFVAKNLRPRQKKWNNATQSRIAATSSVLSSMKIVKLLGMQQNLTDRIQGLRKEELFSASKLRWIMVYYNASANAVGLFSPAITLVVYALLSVARGDDLDTETAFTTMAILSMVTHPANMIMTIVPRAVASFAAFERIQSFLLQQSLHDIRESLSTDPLNSSTQIPVPGLAIQIRELRIGHKSPILEKISIEVAASSFTILSGRTGSGKSTLLRAIIGEVTPSHGSIGLSTRQIAYCAQKPWLPNGTVKEAIYGPGGTYGTCNQTHDGWYDKIIKICCLDHDFANLPNGDQTQIGSRGLNLSGGQRQRVSLARALFAKCDILLLDDTFSGLDGDTEQTVFKNLFRPTGLIRQLNTTVILVSNSHQYFNVADHIVVLEDHRILNQGHWQDIKIGGAPSAKLSSGYRTKDNNILSTNFEKLGAQLLAKDETEMDLSRKSGDPALYGYYLGFIDLINIFYLVAATASYSFFITAPQYWLRLWTEKGSGNSSFYVGGFLFLSTMSWAMTSAQMWSVLIRLAPQSGSRIHQRLLNIVTSAPLSYFSVNDNGAILNRFSQDIQLVDKELPSALQTVVTQIFKLLAQIIVLCTVEKWLVVSLPACALLVYIVQKAYLRTSRQLRFLELESRAGVFSNFLETVEGLETIRSFGWSRAVIQENILSVNNSQQPEFLLLCLQRWLNIVLDLLTAAVATSVITTAVVFRGHVSGAQVGIALNIMLVANTTLLKLVESWTTLETSLGAMTRVKTLEEMTPFEGAKAECLEPPENWPPRGNIEFKNITASYHPESVALRDLNLTIPQGQKLVVCGRTGSGKSTLLLTLLRLLELKSGKIEIDGIDIKHVRLDVLRRRCFVAVSQDPLLLPNETLRFNLDPGYSASDDMVISALANAKLLSHFFEGGHGGGKASAVNISDSDKHPILDRKVSLFPELSVGQCQLFALCRALVKCELLRCSGVKPIILLDEITSSVDTTTESLIHHIIDEEFTEKGHTVILVIHKLSALGEHTKTGRDAVALIADGRLQELIEDLGPATFRRLLQTE
ncbi:Multidrug resistance-associated protein 6 [Talaromyces islandicus]|uniref:Multidrug resistance-associated protein 6 n=1 Tax=Talaromyces islandicus TaxID=28573 RepID=A0A0U1LU38_TALIS|nr:Multidrug resistance-associated protein 6 [Talaromyces islandicus]